MELPVHKPGEHTFVVGTTGGGKSVLAKALFCAVDHGIAVNTKAETDRKDWPAEIGTLVRGDKIYDIGGGRFNWIPDDTFMDDRAAQERFFRWALKVGHRTIYIDEMNDVAESAQSYARYLKLCYTRGRSVKLSMLGTTQFPNGVPTWMFGQCRHKYVFSLEHPDQRKVAEKFFESPIPWDAMEVGSYKFMYKGPKERFGPVALEYP